MEVEWKLTRKEYALPDLRQGRRNEFYFSLERLNLLMRIDLKRHLPEPEHSLSGHEPRELCKKVDQSQE